jgi:hypothetical protein
MEITFHDANEAPQAPSDTRIIVLSAEPWPDGHRVSVQVQLTPYQQRPNLHISICDAQGQEKASVGAVHIRQTQIAFTIHLRHLDTAGQYRVVAYVAYADPDLGIVDQAETTFEIH